MLHAHMHDTNWTWIIGTEQELGGCIEKDMRGIGGGEVGGI